MVKKIIFICFVFTVLFSVKTNAQGLIPPKPLENDVYDSMVGEWTGESNMMGTPFIENLKIYWDLNHQFIILDLMATGKENTNMSYQGKGIFGIDNKGNAKTWWFDSWGASGMAMGTGFFQGGVLTISDGNEMFKETRTFTVSGNELTMHAKGSMYMDGKDMPFDQTTVYRKK